MPTISHLQICNFRNLTSITLDAHPHFNIFYGNNGAGKTSILEAIYYLAHGRSFRTHRHPYIIQYDQEQVSISISISDNTLSYPMGIEKSQKGERRIRINGESQTTIAALAKQLPALLISPMSYRFFHDGPKTRRQSLDWLMFHVEPKFHTSWKHYQRTLKQRNSALKARHSATDIKSWNTSLAQYGEQLHQLRQTIVTKMTPTLIENLSNLLPGYLFSVDYRPGWNTNTSLSELLNHNLQQDTRLGYTTVGPHRADIQLKINHINAQDVLSQGQQKLAVYAISLAQGILFYQSIGHSPIYLIDDLPAELDPSKIQAITTALSQLNAQVFLTGITRSSFDELSKHNPHFMFHVEHGTTILQKNV